MSKAIIYHNPRCSKSREVLSILKEKECDFTIIEYLKNPLNASQIKTLLKQLQLNPIDIIRTNENIFSELQLSSASSNDELIKAMITYPILLERPIITNGTKAVIGRPPKNVEKIL